MFDATNRLPTKRDRSLLSLGAEKRAPEPAEKPGSLLAIAGSTREADAALRHRLARSRREAVPSPLLEALAANGGHDEQVAPQVETSDRPEAARSPAEMVTGWFGRLFRRDRASSAPSAPAIGRAAEPVEPGMANAEAPSEPRPEPRVTATAEMPGRQSAPVREASRGANAAVALTETAEAVPAQHRASDEYWQPLIDPFKVIGGITRSRWLIIGTTLAGAVIGVFVALSTPRIYEAYSELLVDPRDLKLVDREITTTGLPSDATLALVENQARVLTSATVLNKVVDQLNLTEDPEFNGESGGGLGVGSTISFIRSLITGRDGVVDPVRKRSLAVEHLGRALTVERGGKTFIIVVTVRTRDPEKSALIANTMGDVFLQTSGELQAGTAGRATDELTGRLEELRTALGEAERKVAAFKSENDIVDPQGRLITDDEIVKVNDQLSIAKARTIELNARAATTRGITAAAAASGALPEETASPMMTELRSQYAAAKQEADRIAVRLGPRHPTRLAIEAQVAGALDGIASELRRISSSLQVELARAVEQEQNLAARLAQLKARQGGIGDDLVTLHELEREATAKRAVYEAFLLRARETAEQRDINAANVTVISKAYPPLDPNGPGRSTIAASGAILGLLLGIGLGAGRGGWESLRENMAARPRRRRRLREEAGAMGDDQPPQGTPPGKRAIPKDTPAKGEGEKMGLFNRIRRAAAPAEPAFAPSAYAAPGYHPGAAVPPGYAPHYAPAAAAPAYAPPAPGYASAPTYPAAPVYQPSPPAHAQAPYGWPQPQNAAATYPGAPAHPGWGPQPAPQSFASAPMHPAYGHPPAQQQVYGQPYPPVSQPWQPAPAWANAPPAPAYPPQPMYYAAPAHFHLAVQSGPEPSGYAEPARRPSGEALRPTERAEQTAMEEIRDSLREFREAVQGLADTRQRRRVP